eukprot:scpid61645/ scgid29173/ 
MVVLDTVDVSEIAEVSVAIPALVATAEAVVLATLEVAAALDWVLLANTVDVIAMALLATEDTDPGVDVGPGVDVDPPVVGDSPDPETGLETTAGAVETDEPFPVITGLEPGSVGKALGEDVNGKAVPVPSPPGSCPETSPHAAKDITNTTYTIQNFMSFFFTFCNPIGGPSRTNFKPRYPKKYYALRQSGLRLLFERRPVDVSNKKMN